MRFFFCLLLSIFLPKAKPYKVVLFVFIGTCALEFVQVLNNDFLGLIRSNFIGRTIIGSSFSLTDFPYYIIGSGLGWIFLLFISRLK